jgi:hypothetical protein
MLLGENQFVVLKLNVKFKGPVDTVKAWLFANATVGKAKAKSVNSITRLIFTPFCKTICWPISMPISGK